MARGHSSRQGRLNAAVGRPLTLAPPGSGVQLVPGADQAALLVPDTYDPGRPAPLLVMLHGAGGHPAHSVGLIEFQAQRDGFLVLAPKSRATTWDVIRGGFGPDVDIIDEALRWTSEHYAISAGSLAVGGFSDGGSYALSLGLGNGELFRHVLAFSPGSAAPTETVGHPRIYISHGRKDQVLPFERCGAALAKRLTNAGYDVRFEPFDDGHVVPTDKVEAAVRRWLGTRSGSG